jgi:hypothetical protein
LSAFTRLELSSYLNVQLEHINLINILASNSNILAYVILYPSSYLIVQVIIISYLAINSFECTKYLY